MATELGPLYHWSPRQRLGGIKRYGLMPGKRNITGSLPDSDVWEPLYEGDIEPPRDKFRQPAVCTSTDPAEAWAYSYDIWKIVGTFDLWQFRLVDTDDVEILRQWGARIFEVRIHNRIHKRRLIWVGERTIIQK